MIELDGSLGEGGGRFTDGIGVEFITGQAFRIHNIRANRPKPGLMREHLACVQAAVAVGGGAEKTLSVNTAGQAVQIGEPLTFTPGEICGGITSLRLAQRAAACWCCKPLCGRW